MIRGETLSVQFGFCTGGAHGIATPAGRILTLQGPDVARFARGVLAVVDAGDDAGVGGFDVLKQAFVRQTAAGPVTAGQEEQYVAGVLQSLVALGFGHNSQSVIVAVWLGSDVVLGSLGSSRAYLCRGDGIKDVTPTLPAEEASEVHLLRLHLEARDALVLASGSPAGLDTQNLRQTILYSSADLSLHDQAAWLVNVAGARSSVGAGVGIMRFSSYRSRRGALLQAGRSSKWKATAMTTATLAIVAALAGVGLVLPSVLAKGTSVKKPLPRATATPVMIATFPMPHLVRPFGTLSSSQAQNVAFCWQDPVRTQMGQLEILSGSSRVRDPLTPASLQTRSHSMQCAYAALDSGQTYRWRLSVSATGYTVRSSPWSSFRIAAKPKPPRHTYKPKGRAGRAKPHHSTPPAKRR